MANHAVILSASNEYLEEKGNPENLEDLMQHRLIKISSMEFLEPRQLDDYFTNLGIEKKFELTVNDTDMAYHAVMSGIGIAPLPAKVTKNVHTNEVGHWRHYARHLGELRAQAVGDAHLDVPKRAAALG